MPNRIIKESFCTSEKIAALSDFEFRLWVGLITQADDAGRGDARPAVIKGRIFPFRDRLTIKDVDAALHALADKSCISLYSVGGKSYYYFPTWTEHQRIRDCKPKYPDPTVCGKLPQVAADCGELPPESNPIQSESKSESKSKSDVTRAFEEFWEIYPRKVGKVAARKAFCGVPAKAYPLISPAVERQKLSAQWKKDGGQYIPNPATWLNRGQWEDEAEPRAKSSGPSAGEIDEMQRLIDKMGNQG